MPRSALAAFAAAVSPAHAPAFPTSASQLKTELLSGLTVALALVPEAVAFAFVAGVHPLLPPPLQRQPSEHDRFG